MHIARRFVASIGLAALSLIALPLMAQSAKEIGDLASRIAKTTAKAHPQRVLIAHLNGCLLDPQLCAAYHEVLKAAMLKTAPGAQFVDPTTVLEIVRNRGFLGIDAYDSYVLRASAPETGADFLVTENLTWAKDRYEFASEFIEVQGDKSLLELKSKVVPTQPNAEDKPVILKDPDSGVALVEMRDMKSRSGLFHFVVCDKCPDPVYPAQARDKKTTGTVMLIATVTDQGVAQDIHVVKSLEPSLDNAAEEAIRKWIFKPAIGMDGKPFATRIPFQITFRLA